MMYRLTFITLLMLLSLSTCLEQLCFSTNEAYHFPPFIFYETQKHFHFNEAVLTAIYKRFIYKAMD